MAEVLSQQQIDELLGNLLSGDVDLDEIKEQSAMKKVKDYDFRSPKKFTREQLKLIDSIHDSFAKFASSQLSSLLRIPFEIEVNQIEEQQFSEFNNALNDSVMVGLLDLQKDDQSDERQQMLIEVAKPIAFFVIDKFLGGSGDNLQNRDSEFTDIEISLMEYFFNQLITAIKNSWINFFTVNPYLTQIETNSRMLQSIAPGETVIIVVLQITVNNTVGTVNICLPKSTLDAIFKVFESKHPKPSRSNAASEEKAQIRKKIIMEKLNDSPLNVKGLLGQTEITLQELLNLEAGDIIPLNTAVNENKVVVHIEDIPWFYGAIGTKNNKYAIKIVEQY